jgi:hypothetical protein
MKDDVAGRWSFVYPLVLLAGSQRARGLGELNEHPSETLPNLAESKRHLLQIHLDAIGFGDIRRQQCICYRPA